ncbi:hypothetical protein [Tenacibaculum singaporense]|uniref:hypothetical protein n=1 Tax=Tenacibaculum singaporense TaxID=2358479 RepID=UPI000F681C3C|nr:hypothetical protein [Tenacibaculum singaporense]RSC92063.1 hypothetical protein EI424_14865 [Tenacibaculum singaporense]
MKNSNKVIFTKVENSRGWLNLMLLLMLIFIIIFYLSNNYIVSIFSSFILSFLIFILMNKKWFKKISFDEEGFNVVYLYNLFGRKKYSWSYSELTKIVYYEYMSKTPAHCKVIGKDKSVNRFDYNMKVQDSLFIFIKSKGVEIEYYNKDSNQYRK